MAVNSTGRIVVGLDGSEASRQALDWAIDQADKERRPLTLVHALGGTPPAYTDAAIALPQQAYGALRAKGQDLLDAARARVSERAQGVDVDELLDFVDPRELLLEAGSGAAMLVVGSRGRGPIRSLLLGSVGVALARHASCPVIIHRPWRGDVERRGVFAAIDATEQSRPVLEFAYQQAALGGLPLTVLHDVELAEEIELERIPVDASGDDLAPERMVLAEAMAGMSEKYPDVHVTTEISRGRYAVVAASESEHMSLLVVGAHHGTGVEHLMYGSVSVAVVEHARCPVAVVPVGSRDD